MPKLLIVCPTFQPVNTPDQHRIRLSIPWFQKAGWECTVLAVEPQYIEAPVDPVLSQLEDPCKVIRVKAISSGITRRIGLGNLGYRAWWQLKRAGNRLLNAKQFDLVYFSTTVFPAMTLGRVWKRKFDIPFILDMQDPWRNDYYLTQPKTNRPPKFKIAYYFDSILEKYTVPHCDGLISVSEAYPSTLNKRYNINKPFSVIPFASSRLDFEIVKQLNIQNPVFKKDVDQIQVVYTGAVTPGMPLPLKTMLKAFKSVMEHNPEQNIHIYFVGSSYAPNAKSIALPIAEEVSVENCVTEIPDRVGYFEAMKVMKDADFLILPGSMEAGYTASKIYPYILSEKPIIALTHVKSSVSAILKDCNAGPVITFNDKDELQARQGAVEEAISSLIAKGKFKTDVNWEFYSEFSDETMANKQISFFKTILKQS
ncbi:glycosyltransferase [Carboxylicivirga linearis]|uniref:Glycosyltransferase n=1 Tax=Carboxylicivirga linearis TaxID=1628157 RepID=A0ABS5JUE6_9BACT|nr:glycosyltransferase [Carboxylicivirga linearis]MBS2098538.1 glycosyltransferase [Carboxylicivirga linearis]